ncbi:MAG: adenosylmethionine decarboxylase [candidate division WOR-3 bacterium]
MKPVGEHYIVEASGCDPQIIGNVEKMQEILVNAAHKANVKIWAVSFHRFPPQGVSGVIVISESHISVHTWPEYGYVALDIYTCGEHSNPEEAVNFALQEFKAENVHISEITRGLEEGDRIFFHSIITWEEELTHYRKKLKQESFLKMVKNLISENEKNKIEKILNLLGETFEEYSFIGIYKKDKLLYSVNKKNKKDKKDKKNPSIHSEIQFPLYRNSQELGKLVIRTSSKDGFKEEDEFFLKKVSLLIEENLDGGKQNEKN